MIYITGDTHSEFRRFNRTCFPEQREMTKSDCCIVAGDFGGVWFRQGDRMYGKSESSNLDMLDARPFTTLFVPGNHENYERLMSDEFPVKEWNGGLVKEIRPSVLMLMRGEMYEIDGAKLFAFGGARSHDIGDGLLDGADPRWKSKAKRLELLGRYQYRVRGVSWWEQELPDREEMDHGLETLEKHHWKTDFVVTHCAPSSVQALMGYHDNDALTRYLEEIHRKLAYTRWFFGHYHDDRQVTDKDILLYQQIIRIW